MCVFGDWCCISFINISCKILCPFKVVRLTDSPILLPAGGDCLCVCEAYACERDRDRERGESLTEGRETEGQSEEKLSGKVGSSKYQKKKGKKQR